MDFAEVPYTPIVFEHSFDRRLDPFERLLFMNTLSTIVFYAFAVLTIGFALVVVTSRNVFHSAIALTVTLSMVAGLSLFWGPTSRREPGAGGMGGIMIIMLFVVMLSSSRRMP